MNKVKLNGWPKTDQSMVEVESKLSNLWFSVLSTTQWIWVIKIPEISTHICSESKNHLLQENDLEIFIVITIKKHEVLILQGCSAALYSNQPQNAMLKKKVKGNNQKL